MCREIVAISARLSSRMLYQLTRSMSYVSCQLRPRGCGVILRDYDVHKSKSELTDVAPALVFGLVPIVVCFRCREDKRGDYFTSKLFENCVSVAVRRTSEPANRDFKIASGVKVTCNLSLVRFT